MTKAGDLRTPPRHSPSPLSSNKLSSISPIDIERELIKLSQLQRPICGDKLGQGNLKHRRLAWLRLESHSSHHLPCTSLHQAFVLFCTFLASTVSIICKSATALESPRQEASGANRTETDTGYIDSRCQLERLVLTQTASTSCSPLDMTLSLHDHQFDRSKNQV